MTCKVFLSYTHDDKDFVSSLCSDLEGRGADVWIDEKNIDVGDSISKAVEEGISSSDYVCLVLSPSSVKRTWVQREYRAALALQLSSTGKHPRIFPIITEKVDIPLLLKDI